eukprot:1243476-Rhodomonas_salina.1
MSGDLAKQVVAEGNSSSSGQRQEIEPATERLAEKEKIPDNSEPSDCTDDENATEPIDVDHIVVPDGEHPDEVLPLSDLQTLKDTPWRQDLNGLLAIKEDLENARAAEANRKSNLIRGNE